MKKGFTIAETLGTIIILCVIAMIAFPPILNLVKGTSDELDESTKKLVITAATTYVSRHGNDYPKVEDEDYYISIQNLLKEDLISNNLIESSNLKLESCVNVKVNNDKYEYNVEITCSQGE